MSEMIKRVARAICCPDGCNGDTGSGRPCDIEREDSTSMHQARAAIEVMREPTSNMMAADRPYEYTAPSGEFVILTDVATKYGIWRAMIDAALSSQERQI